MKTEKEIRSLLKATLKREGECSTEDMSRLFIVAKTLFWVLGD